VIRIQRVLAPNPGVYTLEGTNTWIVGADPSIVIDPGPPLVAHLDEVVRVAGSVSHILVTHDHEDHAEGATVFAERVRAPLHAWRLPGAERIKDGARFSAGGGCTVVAVHTPGHSADHVCFFAPEEGAVFTGDTVLGRGTSFIDPPEGDLVKYLHSLQVLSELSPRTIYPGHGPVVLHAGAKLREYLAHRAEREEQVVAGIAEGPVTVDALVATIYAAYAAEVRPLAARSVTAHLLKLEAEGRAERKGRGESQTWSASAPKACARCGRPVKGRGTYCSSCLLTMLQEGADRADGTAAHSEPTTRKGERTT
jgi:glyoxylase-like metal-dependent hydrolase (beta-lactamase superfamily II)